MRYWLRVSDEASCVYSWKNEQIITDSGEAYSRSERAT